MKLRKSLVAAATALTVATAGMSAPAFAESSVPGSSDSNNSATTNDGDTAVEEEAEGEPTTDDGGSSDMTPKDIKDWIGVFTAIITAAGALFAFMQKYFVK